MGFADQKLWQIYLQWKVVSQQYYPSYFRNLYKTYSICTNYTITFYSEFYANMIKIKHLRPLLDIRVYLSCCRNVLLRILVTSACSTKKSTFFILFKAVCQRRRFFVRCSKIEKVLLNYVRPTIKKEELVWVIFLSRQEICKKLKGLRK